MFTCYPATDAKLADADGKATTQISGPFLSALSESNNSVINVTPPPPPQASHQSCHVLFIASALQSDF